MEHSSGGKVETWKQFYYSKEGYDATNIVALSFTVESPWGKGMTGLEGLAVKGWSLSAVMHYQSGAPLTAQGSTIIGNTNTTANGRAMIVPGQSLYSSSQGQHCPAPGLATHICWINPAAFVIGSANTLAAGDAPINDIIGPNYYQWDLSARKTFTLPWREGMAFEIQGDAYNAFNRTNWNNPGTGFTTTATLNASNNDGTITGSLPARVVSIGGKFIF